MQFEKAQNPDVENLDQWRMALPDGNALLLDPATGETLDPNAPPEWIRDDPRLVEGFAYLAANAGNINMKIFFTRHGQANDLGSVEKGYFEQQVQAADAYAFEIHGWNRDEWLRSLGAFAISGRAPQFQSSFNQRVWSAVAKTRTPSFSPDIEHGAGQLEDMFERINPLWLKKMEGSSDEVTVDEVDWMYAETSMREWYIIGKLGCELKRLFGHEPARALNVFMTIGGLHRDLARKLEALRVTVKTATAISPRDGGLDSNLIASGLSSSIVPHSIRSSARPSKGKAQQQTTPSATSPRPAPAPEAQPANRGTTVGDVGAQVRGNAESLPLDGVAAAMAAVDARIGELYGKMAMAPDDEREALQSKIGQLMSARAYLEEAFAGLSQSRDAMEQVLDNMGLDWRTEGF
ncbi:MAG TPA: hypothetical protein VLH86_03340 [Patescibacteria group bacterium]|nr:hypothetical protein [Patescibacteria group bacterium]